MKEPISILLVDDHPIIRDAIKMYFDDNIDITISGEASNGLEALKLLDENSYDIVITDIVMPKMNGIDLMTKVQELYPDQKVIVLTMVNETSNIRKMLASGAKGYILKNCPKKEIVKAISQVSSGKTYYDKEVFDIMVDDIAAKPNGNPNEEKPPLSKREIEVLKLILDEKSNAEIAEALFISQKTVGSHKQHMMKKTKSKTLAGLIIYAVEHKLLDQ
ncbi:MAG: response regulator transcription factor [Cyclobacteriaceae bacterium]